MMNRRSDSGKISYRLDVKRSPSHRNAAEPIYEDVLGTNRDDGSDSGMSTPRKISKFGSKTFEGEVQVKQIMILVVKLSLQSKV